MHVQQNNRTESYFLSTEQGLSVMIIGTSIWYWNPDTTIHNFMGGKNYSPTFKNLNSCKRYFFLLLSKSSVRMMNI